MPVLNYNIPSFSPPIGYQHRIDANAAWVRSRPSFTCTETTTGRNLLPPLRGNSGRVTPWGTPLPAWRPGQRVLVQLYSPNGAWWRGSVVHVLPPLEFESLSMDEIEKLPPSRLEKLFCRYTVELAEEGTIAKTWTEIEEKFLAPTSLGRRLEANATQFRVGEQVQVETSGGDKRRNYIGHISSIAGDKILRNKWTWHVVPRLYKVYINELETSGHWTAKSIISLEPSKDEEVEEDEEDEEDVPLLPRPMSIVPLQSTDA